MVMEVHVSTYRKYLVVFLLLLAIPYRAHAATDSFLGTDSADGVPVAMTPSEAGSLISLPASALHVTLTWANSLANAFKVGKDTSNYWALYHDVTDGLQIVCVIAGVPNDCNYIRQLASGKTFSVKNSSGTDIFTVTESTGAITNATINGEGSGNTITLTEEQWFNVAACQNTTASHIFDTPTTNIPAETCDTGSNTQKAYLAFDATTDESIYGHWVLPTGFTGSIDIKFKWKTAATSGAVGWCFQMIRVADGSTSDPAFPAQASGNCVSDTAKGTTLQENDATISGVTCTSCTAGDHVYWRLSRDANGGAVTDDASGDAFLLAFGRVWRVAH